MIYKLYKKWWFFYKYYISGILEATLLYLAGQLLKSYYWIRFRNVRTPKIDLEFLKTNGPTKSVKLRIVRYYLGTKCICEELKKQYRWNCSLCESKTSKDLFQMLESAHSNYVWAILIFLDHIEKNNGQNTNRQKRRA